MGDLLLLTPVGVKVVLVHGGGPEITDLLKRLGKKSEFINGLRVTDREAADIVQMVLAGKVGKGLRAYPVHGRQGPSACAAWTAAD